jgi:hypothetical protein
VASTRRSSRYTRRRSVELGRVHLAVGSGVHFWRSPTEVACPIDDPHWPKGGCKTTLATSVGARIRHQLDRDSEAYKQVYKQRTATERINALAKETGIERPKLRNGTAIANQNTLIYVLLNLRALQRVRQRKAEPS